MPWAARPGSDGTRAFASMMAQFAPSGQAQATSLQPIRSLASTRFGTLIVHCTKKPQIDRVLRKYRSGPWKETSMRMLPAETDEADLDTELRKAAFSERLKAAMWRKGWGLSETARQTSQHLGPDAKFGRAHVWHYLHRRAMPRVRQLNALSQALEVEPRELLGFGPAPERYGAPARASGMVRALDHGDGTVFLEVAQRVPWEIALEILRVVQRSRTGDESFRDEDSARAFGPDLPAPHPPLSRSAQ
jgi:hypothetical protein